MANLSLNPMATTNAAGTFGVNSNGYIQGVAMDDPANRFNLVGGTVASTETTPLWGGVAIAEMIPGTKSRPTGSNIRRATSVAELEGFTVFNQAHNGLTTPNSPVPLYASGMSCSYYRLGSNMRVPLKASAEVVALGASGTTSVKTPLAWDFVNAQLTTLAGASYSGGNLTTTALTFAGGVATATFAAAHGITAGKFITVSGATPSDYNGTYQVQSVPSATTLTFIPVTTPSGAATVQATVAAPNATAQAGFTLPVKIIGIQSGNSLTVSYDAASGFLTWNKTDSCALVLL